jgi:serine/threonine protein kinase
LICHNKIHELDFPFVKHIPNDKTELNTFIPPSDQPVSHGWFHGKMLLDDYRIDRILGKGGMGEVVLVNSLSTKQWYAVKRIRPCFLDRDHHRRMFLQELLTWSELPEHPNLTAFRFFRSYRNELLVFTDYIAGGSLASMIANGQIDTLSTCLRIAFQTATGLSVAHTAGVIHQDIKPENVLMDLDGTARITDFGLARMVRVRDYLPITSSDTDPEDTSASNEPEATVTCKGGTTAYCSPEQKERKHLTKASDIWSWGLTVLAVFTGGVCWSRGDHAPETLRKYLSSDLNHNGNIPMPDEFAAVLSRCFHPEPEKRWNDFSEIIKRLIELDPTLCVKTGIHLSGQANLATPVPYNQAIRSTIHGLAWRNPSEYLQTACRMMEIPPNLYTKLYPDTLRTRKAMAIADLIIQEEAIRLMNHCPESVRFNSDNGLIRLYLEKAQTQRFLGDFSGAIQSYDCIIDEYNRSELEMPALTEFRVFREKTLTLFNMGRFREADAELGHLFWKLCNRKDESLNDPLSPQDLVELKVLRAKTLKELGDRETSLMLYDEAICEYENIVTGSTGHPLLQNLAAACMNKANLFSRTSAEEAFMSLYDRAIDSLEMLSDYRNDPTVRDDLARVYGNKAAAHYSRAEYTEAASLFERAIVIRETLFEKEGFSEVEPELAMHYQNLGNCRWAHGDVASAMNLYDRSIGIRERLVFMEGHDNLGVDLVTSYINQSYLFISIREYDCAESLTHRAENILRRRLDVDPGEQLYMLLARIMHNQAQARLLKGDLPGASQSVDESCRLWNRLISDDNSTEYPTFGALSDSLRARILNACGNRDQAISTLRSALKVIDDTVFHNNRIQFILDWSQMQHMMASFQIESGDLSEAQMILNRLIENLKEFERRNRQLNVRTELSMAFLKRFVLINPGFSGNLPSDAQEHADILLSNADCTQPDIAELLHQLNIDPPH